MATLAEAEKHRAAIDDVVALAVAELVSEWPGLPTGDPLALRRELADLMLALIPDFAEMTGTLGADWYEDLRVAANAPGSYTAVLPDLPPTAQIRNSAEWASTAAYADEQKALADAAEVVDRLLADVAREAVVANAERDPAPARFARYASASACAFCAMNALRGPVYRSEHAAADKYHAYCRCIAVPVWRRSDYQEAPFVTDWRKAYYDATSALGGANDTKAILAHMRQTTGLR